MNKYINKCLPKEIFFTVTVVTYFVVRKFQIKDNLYILFWAEDIISF